MAELVVAGDDPERIRPRMEQFAAAAEQAVARAGGWIEHSTGVMVVAAFGVPIACQDHAQRALRVALELAGAERVRIGVDTGEVLVSGSEGTPLLIVGDAVQLALALAHTATSGEALVGQRCRAIAEHGLRVGWQAAPAGGLGVLDPVTACSSVVHPSWSSLPRPSPSPAPSGHPTWSPSSARRVSERRRSCGGSPKLPTPWSAPAAVSRTGKALPTGRSARSSAQSSAWTRTHRSPGWSNGSAITRAAAATLGMDILSGMHPAVARERVHGAWIGWISEVAARHPLVVVVEDVHWAADDLLDLLERTVREATGPLLLVATARPELPARRPDFGAARAGTPATVRLKPLLPDETLQLVGNCSAAPRRPPSRRWSWRGRKGIRSSSRRPSRL